MDPVKIAPGQMTNSELTSKLSTSTEPVLVQYYKLILHYYEQIRKYVDSIPWLSNHLNQDFGTNELLSALLARVYITLSRPFVNLNRLLYSEAYLFPLKGIQFFYENPKCWSSLQVVLPHFAISFTVYCLIWSFFFPLQFFVLTIFGGPLGVIVAAIATIQQCHYYSCFATNKILLPQQLDQVFDTVLIEQGHYSVVLKGKLRRITPTPFVTRFRRLMWGIPTEIVFYPLDLLKNLIPTIYISIPILGPILLSMNNASELGLNYQQRYFKLKNLKPQHVAMLQKKRMGHYASFGFVAAMLELTPILGFIFSLSNTAGAALWCCQIEQEIKSTKRFQDDKIDTVRGILAVLN